MRVKKKRNYKKEYKKFQAGGREKKDRAARNRRRRKALKGGRVRKGDGKDLHHFVKGGKIVTVVESQSKNRGRAEKSRLRGSKRN